MESKMRIISFNVNGIKSMSTKSKDGEKTGSLDNNVLTSLITEYSPDILCFQEIKCQSSNDLKFLKKHFKNIYTNHSKARKGYSGTAILTNLEPEWVSYDFEHFPEHEIGAYAHFDFINEGRLTTAKFNNCVVVNSYTINSKDGLIRIDSRVEWEALLRNYLIALEIETKLPVILCGDLNCAHMPIDIYNPKGKNNTPGYAPKEREEFGKMLDQGFIDTFRHLNPSTVKYTYWSNFAKSRERNVGWRIDYFLVSECAKELIQFADCLNDFKGSDHCPVLCDFGF